MQRYRFNIIVKVTGNSGRKGVWALYSYTLTIKMFVLRSLKLFLVLPVPSYISGYFRMDVPAHILKEQICRNPGELRHLHQLEATIDRCIMLGLQEVPIAKMGDLKAALQRIADLLSVLTVRAAKEEEDLAQSYMRAIVPEVRKEATVSLLRNELIPRIAGTGSRHGKEFVERLLPVPGARPGEGGQSDHEVERQGGRSEGAPLFGQEKYRGHGPLDLRIKGLGGPHIQRGLSSFPLRVQGSEGENDFRGFFMLLGSTQHCGRTNIVIRNMKKWKNIISTLL